MMHDQSTEVSTRPESPLGHLLDNPWVVIGLLFLVTGALGIPLIWLSRAFSPLNKIILTIAVTLYTMLLFWGFWLIMSWAYHRVVA